MAGRRRKRSRFGDIMSGLFMAIALVVFLFSGYMLYSYYQEYRAGTEEYNNLEDSYVVEDSGEEDLESLENDQALQQISGREVRTVVENGREITVPVVQNPIDFAELEKVNEDTVGWIRISALDISYPVVQGEDNDYYLHRTFEKEENIAGCIFLNAENKDDFTDQNTIIYGHNMKNDSMFGKLSDFREEEVFNKSRYFWIFTEDLIYQYRIFSASVVNQTGLTYQTFFLNNEFDEFINAAFENSEVDTSGVEVTRDDRVVTLSTCTGDDATRFVVMGKLAQIYASK
ncbi:MAG TPA: class B sortase [Candidatus Choladousia intestinipullorum]|nr:class B sortase [Candidatus Choladousia intestinipullorum]